MKDEPLSPCAHQRVVKYQQMPFNRTPTERPQEDAIGTVLRHCPPCTKPSCCWRDISTSIESHDRGHVEENFEETDDEQNNDEVMMN